MVAGIDEPKMSSKRLVKLRPFSGATCYDMYHYLLPTLERKPSHVILHVGTNDVAHIQSHLCKLQIDMIKNESIISNHLNSRGLHLNGKVILQFAKNLIEVIRKL